MKLEKINLEFDYVNYKGKLDTNTRLEHMSKYDCLLFASQNEGLPMIIYWTSFYNYKGRSDRRFTYQKLSLYL